MSVGHPERAAAFAADEARAHWHDQALWFVREKRDRAAALVPDWEPLRDAASRIRAHTQGSTARPNRRYRYSSFKHAGFALRASIAPR